MLVGHRVVCYEDATKDDVLAAHIVVAAFKTPRRMADGWSFPPLLEQLGLSGSALVGKVLVHLDDEYGAKTPRTEDNWRDYLYRSGRLSKPLGTGKRAQIPTDEPGYFRMTGSLENRKQLVLANSYGPKGMKSPHRKKQQAAKRAFINRLGTDLAVACG